MHVRTENHWWKSNAICVENLLSLRVPVERIALTSVLRNLKSITRFEPQHARAASPCLPLPILTNSHETHQTNPTLPLRPAAERHRQVPHLQTEDGEVKEQFKEFRFKADTMVLIERAISIIEELQAEGYTLTLRQLYYQCVARDIIPNKQTEYKRLGSILNDARLAGLIDWDAIEDRTRNLESVSHWTTPADIIQSAAESFRLDKWDNQKHRVEVWVEKDALVGVLEKACRPLDVAWFSCRGYTSQSELYGAGKRLARYARNRQQPVVIHLGDHDPSGIDMTRDITDRLSLFAGRPVKVERIALNMAQIEEFNPPPNPAKITDSRFSGYEEIHGSESWELDALNPSYIDNLISETVSKYRDDAKWEESKAEEEKHRENLALTSENWEKVERFIKDEVS
jgi:hypothetical protein